MYDGEWVDGRRWGKGTYTYANGDQYIGEFDNDQWHGFGVHTKAAYKDPKTGEQIDGWRYEGTFQEGSKHGEGLLLTGDGGSYEGEFADDKYEGNGTMHYANGDKCEGSWKRGKQNGHCLFEWATVTDTRDNLRKAASKARASSVGVRRSAARTRAST